MDATLTHGACQIDPPLGKVIYQPTSRTPSRRNRVPAGFNLVFFFSHPRSTIAMDSAEKTEAHQQEVTGGPITTMDPQRRIEVEKSLKRKLDARCSLFILLYIMNYLDRNNIAAARLKGLQDDLNLSYNQYATCLSILYVGYILMQVPSNMIINLVSRPSLYIGCSMLLWGLISTLSGVVNNFAGMVAIRFFLGFVEAAFLPGALLILSKWYTRRELTTRNALLFCGNLISNAFSALVGAGVLSNMQGILGHAAWRWLFFSKSTRKGDVHLTLQD